MLGNLYLAVLVAELGFGIYDGLFNDPSIHKWVKVAVLMIGIGGTYCWIKRREALFPKWLWTVLLLVVGVWFFVYLPWYTWVELKIIPDVDVTTLLLPYSAFYILHAPMFFGLYSCAFRSMPPRPVVH